MFPLVLLLGAGYFGYSYYNAFQAFYEKYKWQITDISIDSKATAESNYLKFFYKVKFKLSNPTTFLVKITGVKFGIYYKGLRVADVGKTKAFNIDANHNVMLDADVVIDTTNLGAVVLPLVKEITAGKPIEYTMRGNITCFYLFNIPVEYTFSVL